MLPTQFCAACGAANEAEPSHCFACGRSLSASTDAPADANSPLLHERYRIEAMLGSGGYSTVYRARDFQAGREVAIKQINLQGLSAEEAIEATDTFNREVSVLSSLHHPQIPQMYDQFNDQDHWYLVLHYLQGPTLETYLETRETQGQPLQFDEVLRMALQLGKVLNYLHTRQPPVIFRDLKPSNVIRTLPHETLYLVDFGIARRFRPGQKRDTQALGSPGYAAPEQYGRAQTTPRSDIYSLGALIHHVLSGHDPAESLPGLVPLRLHAEVGEDTLTELVQRMLSADPEQRPATMGEVIATLEAIQIQRMAQPALRIWQPPVPQDLPSSAAGWQQVQVQVPRASSSSWTPASAKPAPGQGGPSRRKVLVGLGGAALAMAGLGGIAAWVSTLPHYGGVATPGVASQPTSQPTRPTFQKLSGTAAVYVYQGHTNVVHTVAWSPDGTYIASGSMDKTVRVWDATSGDTILIYRGHKSMVISLAWSPDGKHVVSSSLDNTIIWDATSGETVVTYPDAGYVYVVSWSPGGKYIVSGSVDNAVRVRDVAGNTVLTYRGHTTSVSSVAWSPDGKYVVSGSLDGTMRIWDATSGQTILTHPSTGYVNAIAWSPDSKFIVSSSRGSTTRIWDATSGYTIRIYPENVCDVTTVAWSSDSQYIAFACDVEDTHVYVWNALNGETVFLYQGHTAPVRSVAWSPDSKYVVSGSIDTTVRIWDAP